MPYVRNAAIKLIPVDACGIYKITNKKDGKFYIGSAAQVRQRLRHHLGALRCGRHTNPHFQRAFTRDGEDSFAMEVILFCDKADLLVREQEFFDQLNPQDDSIGYNISRRADAGPVLVYTDEMRAEISKRFKGKPKSEEHRRRIGEAQKIRQCSPEMRAHLSQKSKEFFSDPTNRAAQSARLKGTTKRGHPCSEEHKKRLSDMRRGIAKPETRKYSPEVVRGWIEKHDRGMSYFQIACEVKIDPVLIGRYIRRHLKENPV